MTLSVPCPPWSRLGKKIESMTRKALYEHQLWDEKGIAVALSGGKDSLTLLAMLAAINGKGFPKVPLYAIHVSGEFSCGAGVNEDFLRALCRGWGVELIIRESHQKLETLECYSCSRERRKLLFDGAKEVGITTIAFGHHRDDSAQTLLMNLLHKAEFAALLPKLEMVDYGVTLIRPLLYVSEQEIRTFAQQEGFARIVCQCPVGQDSLRRQTEDLLRHIEEVFPNARANIAKGGRVYGSDKAKRP